MKTVYLDCGMGAAGDMLTAALLELLPEPDAFLQQLNEVGLPRVTVTKEQVQKCGIGGTHVTVKVHGQEESEEMYADNGGHGHHHHEDGHAGMEGHHHHHEDGHAGMEGHHHHHEDGHAGMEGHHHHHHSHSGMADIEARVRKLHLPDHIKQEILAVYTLIAEAESHVHGVSVQEIHFHEVGTMDALADITAVCMLMDRLAPAQVVCSPIHVGAGQVHCAHGILPVPAPATAYLLQGIPVYGGAVQGELCTPTGAALLRHFVTEFGAMPVICPTAIGYGMGKKDFTAANCVRAILGETQQEKDEVIELSCNLDDMTAEAIGFAMETLLAAGALDAYTVPIGMKKSRPATMLCVMCREADKGKLVRLLFLHTTTIGVRESKRRRYVLDRTIVREDTAYGPVAKKVSSGYGIVREKYEYESLAQIAAEQGIGLAEAERLVRQAKEVQNA